MRKIITIAAVLLTAAGLSILSAVAAQASVCEGNGISCTASGIYSAGPYALVSSNYAGFKVVWTSSNVTPYSSGVPLSWTTYMTYTNVTSSSLTLGCPGSWVNASYVSEEMSGGSGDDGSVPAAETNCSQDPGEMVTVAPGEIFIAWATFDNVPWPGSTVAIQWGNAGTTPSITPWTCAQPSESPWAGYVACGVNADSVMATWAVPPAIQDGNPNSGSGFWVGLGGTTSDVTGKSTLLEQAGTASDMVNGSPLYFAFYELTPAKPVVLSRSKYPVQSGDTITATVTLNSGDQYHFAVTDKGKWAFTKTVTDSKGGHNSAEAIAEWASGLSSCSAPNCPLTDFSTVAFSGIEIDGYTIGSYHSTTIQMYESKVTVSALRKGDAYTAYFQSS
jgi:hypothetical protein